MHPALAAIMRMCAPFRTGSVSREAEQDGHSGCEMSSIEKEEVHCENETFSSHELPCRSGVDRVACARRATKEIGNYLEVETPNKWPHEAHRRCRRIVTPAIRDLAEPDILPVPATMVGVATTVAIGITAAIAIIIAADSATHLTAIRTGRIHTMGTRIRTRTYEGYPYAYSYYSEPAYGYASLVAQVQRRLGELGYYHGVIDGIMGPRTRAAISAYEDTHNLVVDSTISPRLLARMGLA